uniref:TFIIS-type domain-containing protein n=1 Tax=viral metagenome TaxID=1070528 RepID=A0A6C0AZ93_9ZZZZ|tara:strand:+ start:6146 stop:6655 length:510 start_codon:yes stop_codon:yes gene_type:complete
MIKIENSSKFRENVGLNLVKILKNKNYAENLERGIYNRTLQEASEKLIVKKWENIYFVQLYIDKLRMIYNNLKNPKVLDLIISKKIKPHKLAFMTHQEILPEKWNILIEDLKIKNQNKYTPKVEASTDNFTCYKCKSKECSYYQLQTRSADEPMTTFVTCIKCGNRWKC